MDTHKQKPLGTVEAIQSDEDDVIGCEWVTHLSFTGPLGVIRTALLKGFRLLGQIQLLQPLHVSQHQCKPEVKSMLFNIYSNYNLASVDGIQLSHGTCYKSVFVYSRTQTNQSCTTICRDQISSFWNHLLKRELAIDRKFLHSLWVYYRSEHSHSTKAETPRDGPRLQQEQHWES